MAELNRQYFGRALEDSSEHVKDLAKAEGLDDKTKKQMDFIQRGINNAHGQDVANTVAQSTNKVFDA